jgi:hypothetical protein
MGAGELVVRCRVCGCVSGREVAVVVEGEGMSPRVDES